MHLEAKDPSEVPRDRILGLGSVHVQGRSFMGCIEHVVEELENGCCVGSLLLLRKRLPRSKAARPSTST